MEHQGGGTRRHAIKRLKNEFEMWKRGELDVFTETTTTIKRVSWEILKPEGETWDEIIRPYEHFERVQFRAHQHHPQRLRLIYSLKPDELYIGLAEFEGYVVFVFNRGDAPAIMDCAEVGNALYIMRLGISADSMCRSVG